MKKGNKSDKLVVLQAILALLALSLCICLVYGFSGIRMVDSISDLIVQFMAIGIVVLAIGSIMLSVLVRGKMRYVWIILSVITVIIIAVLIHELSNLKFTP